MALYYVGTVNLYGTPDNPHVTATVRRVSDVARLGNVIAWSGTTHLELPPVQSPRAWLGEALAEWRDRLVR